MFPLVGLAASSLAAMMYVSKKKKEGYADSIPLSRQTEAVFDNNGEELIKSNANKYSRIMNVVNPLTNPNFSNDNTINSLANSLQQAAPTVSRNTKGKMLVSTNADVLLPSLENTVTEYVRRCESVQGISPSAFDDPWFAAYCGICHDGGKDNANEDHLGGLYNDPSSIETVQYNAQRAGLKYPAYQPSIGSCAPGKFSVDKAQAERINRQLECEKKQNYDVPGCSQCVDDERFYYVPPETAKAPISIVAAGVGTLTLLSGQNTQEITLTKTAQIITPASALKEGDIIYIKVVGTTQAPAQLASYIYAPTVTGEYRMDVVRLADVDAETGSKPRFAGIMELNRDSYNIIRASSGKTNINLQVNIPYTYIEPNEIEARQCGSAPFLTSISSAEKLASGPCFMKGSKAGNYSLECIQQIFTSAGCGPAGNGFPDTIEKARTWAKNDTIGVLSDKVYQTALKADSGVDPRTGAKLALTERHEAAQFCTGKSYLTPCDAYDTKSGPLGADCISYLYKSQTGGGCQPNGLASPIRSDGSVNQKAVEEAQRAGGVEAVKEYYRSVYIRAMNNGLKDTDRENAVKQCFGTGFVYDKMPAPAQMENKKTLLTNVSANQKSAYERINNDYPYGGNFSPVAVLGRYGMAPWGSTAKFSDPTAYWIWNTYGAEKDAPVYQRVNTPRQDRNIPAFYYIYDNTGSSVINGRVDFMIDNIGDLYVNGDLIAAGHTGGWLGDWRPTSTSIGNQKTIQLKPGRNLIKFIANNFGGPAGLMMACFGPGEKLLFHTDSGWFFRDAFSSK